MNSAKVSKVKQKTITGTFHLISREIGMKAMAIVGQLVLVRLLAPDLFGLFAILSFILSTVETFTDIGLSLTLIQNKKAPNQKQLSTIFFIKLFLTACAILALNLAIPFIEYIYPQFGESETLMLRLLSLTLAIKPLQTLINSQLERDLRYKEIAIIDLSGMLAYHIATVVFALMGFGIWSFIIGVFAMTISELLYTYFFKPWKPSLLFDLKSVREFISIGKYFQLGIFLTIFRGSIIPVMGGTRLTLRETGLLDWSNNMSSVPRVFIDNLGRVSFSSFSRLQDNKDSIARSLEQSFAIISITSIITIPLTLVFGEELISYFLNEKWVAALPALSWYVATIFFLNGVGLFGQALLAIGKTKLMLTYGTIVTLIEIVLSYFLLLRMGFVGIAVGFFISNILLFCIYIWVSHKQKIYIRITSVLIENALILLLTLVSSFIISQLLESTLSFLFFKLIIVLSIYALLVRFISPNAFFLSLRVLKQMRG